MASLSSQIVSYLVRARKEQQLTQKQLAEKMGVHVSFLQRLENNVGNRQAQQFERWAEALGKTIHITFTNNY